MLARLVATRGPFPLRRRRTEPFAALVRAIVGQMLSTRAAATIHARLLLALGERIPTPAGVLRLDEPALRGSGLSRAKASAIASLARLVGAGELDLVALGEADDMAAVAALTQVRGIGEWTAQMFLIFHLARPDVFPARDLGVLEGMRRAFDLAERPTPREAMERAAVWAPYRSAAAWYLWRALETKTEED